MQFDQNNLLVAPAENLRQRFHHLSQPKDTGKALRWGLDFITIEKSANS